MRFVAIKSTEQQAALSMHRTRDLLVKQRTQLVNMIRGLLAEFGVDIPHGLERALLIAKRILEGEALDIPDEAAKIVVKLADLLARKPARIAATALANKTARIVWAIMTRGESYRAGHIPALAA